MGAVSPDGRISQVPRAGQPPPSTRQNASGFAWEPTADQDVGVYLGAGRPCALSLSWGGEEGQGGVSCRSWGCHVYLSNLT